MDPNDTALIALDWGTTSCRAYRLAVDGRVLEQRSGALGILAVADGDFFPALQKLAGDWRRQTPSVPLIASGMIGSRQGWREVPYCAAPASTASLAAGRAWVDLPDGGRLAIVPGVLTTVGDGAPDVMRGEETQILGAVAAIPGTVYCILPGTHSKWVKVSDGSVADFATFMTGELFAVLKAHSILGRTMIEGNADPGAFTRGLDAGLSADGLLHSLFGVRTLALQQVLAAEDGADYPSGLLIGAELREGQAWLEDSEAPLMLIGEGALCDRYIQALRHAGRGVVPGSADAAAHGLFRLACAAQLIDP